MDAIWIPISQPGASDVTQEAPRPTTIITEGHQHLGAVIGSRKHLEDYVEEKVEDWISQIVKLAEFAQSHPQASYVAR